MRAEILTIGDELCRGEIVNTNSSTLAAHLWDLDITTRWMTSCNDDEADIADAIRRACGRADVVLCSGGLGPTEDDLTVDVTSMLADVEPVVDEPARMRMQERFGRLLAANPGQNMEELLAIQLRQVRVPAGSRVLGNPAGAAPCFEVMVRAAADADPVPVICLPGFPREIAGIWEGGLRGHLAELRERAGNVERIARRIYRAFGRGESQLSQLARGLVDTVPGASIHYQVKFPETLVKVVVRDRDAATAQARLDALDAQIRDRLDGVCYGVGDETLVERTTRRLIEQGATVATAESCTGGMIGEMITRLPGSSRAYLGGAIVYANAEKVRQLGVASDTLAQHGAVSEETAREMAVGALERFGTTYAISVTGIAGPDGGTPDKPVGTVWLGLAMRRPTATRDEPDRALVTRKLSWPGARDQVRLLSAWWALAMLDAAIPTPDEREQRRARFVLDRPVTTWRAR